MVSNKLTGRFFRKGADGRLFLWLTLAISTLLASPARATTCPATYYDETVQVKSVHDGDTIRLIDGRKVRLIGINAPEVERGNNPAQPFSAEARELLNKLIRSSNNSIKLLYGKERQDRYKRTLAHLFLPDGTNLQVSLMEQGLATANAYPPNLAYTACYRKVEETARCKSMGIWSHENYAIKNSLDLDTNTDGYILISGKIERVNETKKGIWLVLQGGVMVGIRNKDLPNFSKNTLFSFEGKSVTVRGWIHPKKKPNKGVKFYMRIRHPLAITAENVTKC